MRLRLAFPVLVSPLLFILIACDSTPPISGPVPVHPVGGKVTVKGKPAADVLVAFVAVNAPPVVPPNPDGPAAVTPQPTGKTDAEGLYQLHTYLGNDGAPVGDYKVSVSFAGSAETRTFMSKVPIGGPPVKVPPKYADARKSGLTASVKEGSNEIPTFDLK